MIKYLSLSTLKDSKNAKKLHDNRINVSQDLNSCEKTDVPIKANKAKQGINKYDL